MSLSQVCHRDSVFPRDHHHAARTDLSVVSSSKQLELRNFDQPPLDAQTVVTQFPPTWQSRSNDEWHNVPSRSFGKHAPDQNPAPGEDQLFLHDAPDSIPELYHAFLQNGLVDGPRLSESIHVRSWYLHHAHHREWFRPRVIELDGHWNLWQQDIVSGWRDQIHTDEEIAFYIFHPDPPRAVGHFEIYFDLLVAQGLELPLRSGLITVIRADDRAARAEFAVATSLPLIVSGYQLATEAQQVQQCHIRDCHIWHARNRIPFNYEPVHQVQNGDSFVIEPTTWETNLSAFPKY